MGFVEVVETLTVIWCNAEERCQTLSTGERSRRLSDEASGQGARRARLRRTRSAYTHPPTLCGLPYRCLSTLVRICQTRWPAGGVGRGGVAGWGCRVACTRKAMSEFDRPNHTGVSSCLRTRCLSDLLPVAPEWRYCPEDRNESTGCFPIACTCTVLLGRPASPARACPPDGLVPDPQTHGDPQSRLPRTSTKSTPPRTAAAPTLWSRPQTHGDLQTRPLPPHQGCVEEMAHNAEEPFDPTPSSTHFPSRFFWCLSTKNRHCFSCRYDRSASYS